MWPKETKIETMTHAEVHHKETLKHAEVQPKETKLETMKHTKACLSVRGDIHVQSLIISMGPDDYTECLTFFY